MVQELDWVAERERSRAYPRAFKVDSPAYPGRVDRWEATATIDMVGPRNRRYLRSQALALGLQVCSADKSDTACFHG